jgi:DNA-directed RNA polymerase subunit beta
MGDGFRSFTDTTGTRDMIKLKVQNALNRFGTIHKGLKIDKKYRVEFEDLKISDKEYKISEQKDAILKNKYLTLPISGTVKLIDDEGKVESQYKGLVGRLPYYTGRGTFIYNGNEYTTSNQFRLKSGIYARVKNSGDLESHVNVDPLTGLSFRINMNPKNGLFKATFGKANANLYTLLSEAGISDKKLEETWGKEIVDANKGRARADELDRIYVHLFGDKGKGLLNSEKARKIFDKMKNFKIDPMVTNKTLGKLYSHPNEEALLLASKKILDINRGKDIPDDRDSLEFRTVHGPEDYLAEKLFNRRFAFNLLKQIKRKGVKEFPHTFITKQLASLIKADSRSQPIEEINPLEVLDQQERFLVLGEGGISSLDSVPIELRNVHPSHLGLVDPVRGPESQSVGIDTRIAFGVKKGLHDNHLYAEVIDAKTGKETMVRSDNLAASNLAFPGELGKNEVNVINSKGNMEQINKSKVDYYLKNPNNVLSTLSNLVPFAAAVQGNRLFMAGKIFSQILPLKDGEIANIRSKVPGKNQSFDNMYGKKINGAIAKTSGVISKITKDDITIKTQDGKNIRQGLYKYFPLNRKTYINHEPTVKVGDKVKKGEVLAKTQYTNKNGTLNIGKNLRVAFLPAKGQSYEDGIVVSESAAKKLTSKHLYTYSADLTEKGVIVGKEKFTSLFPTHYTVDQLKDIASNGVVVPGTKVAFGDPIILLGKKKELSSNDILLQNISRKLKYQFEPKAVEWDHNNEGVVVDIDIGSTYIKVNIVTETQASTGDKLTGRYGNKGVISSVWPDGEMPIDEAGKRIEVMLNPMGLISRINPAQVYETLLGKIIDRGKEKEYLVDSFPKEKVYEMVERELKKHGIKDTDDLMNPVNGKKIKKVLTGTMFLLKPSKTGEAGISARDVGTYTADMLPMRGGKEGAKRIGSMETNALLAHNAVHNLRDAITIKGQKNDDYWRAMRLGMPLPTPKTPFMYEKFINSLKSGGVNVERDGTRLQLMPMTDKDVLKLADGKIKNYKMIRSKDLTPEPGGLFDVAITGGMAGKKWSYIDLDEEVLNPLFTDHLAKVLEMKEKDLIKLYKDHGGAYIKELLAGIPMEQKEKELIEIIKKYKSTKRDNAIKALRFIRGLKKSGKKLSDLTISKIPVIPPVYRPVSFIGSKLSLVADANNVYKDLIVTRDGYNELKKELPYGSLGSEREGVFNATKAVFGLGDPVSPKNKQKQVKGFLKQIFGAASPKYGMFQRKVLTKSQDLSARAVAIPDPTLDMDQVGLPEKIAWKIYSPFIMRRLISGGMSAVAALREIENRGPFAKRMLETEILERPVIINRAPTLHKYNIMSLFPVIRKDEVIAVPPIIESGFNLDHDGDQVNIMVPVSEEARREAITTMLPSKNLLSPMDLSAHYLPGHEAIYGMWAASKPKQDKPVKKFNTKREAMEAYKRGEIDINDSIEVDEIS